MLKPRQTSGKTFLFLFLNKNVTFNLHIGIGLDDPSGPSYPYESMKFFKYLQ